MYPSLLSHSSCYTPLVNTPHSLCIQLIYAVLPYPIPPTPNPNSGFSHVPFSLYPTLTIENPPCDTHFPLSTSISVFYLLLTRNLHSLHLSSSLLHYTLNTHSRSLSLSHVCCYPLYLSIPLSLLVFAIQCDGQNHLVIENRFPCQVKLPYITQISL